MLGSLLLLAAMGPGAVDPIDAAIARYRGIESYQVTLKSSHGENTDIIRYSYKRPGFVRMDFVQPHRGAVLIYNPATQVGQAGQHPDARGLFHGALA